jgi:hypothetical protein
MIVSTVWDTSDNKDNQKTPLGGNLAYVPLAIKSELLKNSNVQRVQQAIQSVTPRIFSYSYSCIRNTGLLLLLLLHPEHGSSLIGQPLHPVLLHFFSVLIFVQLLSSSSFSIPQQGTDKESLLYEEAKAVSGALFSRLSFYGYSPRTNTHYEHTSQPFPKIVSCLHHFTNYRSPPVDSSAWSWSWS